MKCFELRPNLAKGSLLYEGVSLTVKSNGKILFQAGDRVIYYETSEIIKKSPTRRLKKRITRASIGNLNIDNYKVPRLIPEKKGNKKGIILFFNGFAGENTKTDIFFDLKNLLIEGNSSEIKINSVTRCAVLKLNQSDSFIFLIEEKSDINYYEYSFLNNKLLVTKLNKEDALKGIRAKYLRNLTYKCNANR